MTGISKSWPRCWGPRLWWLGLLAGAVVAYFVLSNFSMNYWVFIISLLAFGAAGATGGRFAGDWIDNNHRTRRGLVRQEIVACKTMHKWLRRIRRRHGAEIEAAALRRLEGGIERLGGLIQPQESAEPDLDKLADERRKLEQFADEHLADFKKSAVREYVESIGLAVLIALMLRAFVIEAFQIPSGSMIPSLRIGDHLFVNKLSYGIRIPLLPLKSPNIRARSINWSMPEPGDVIVFITPENEEEDFIKRVIAVGGDTVELRDGKVFVNSKPYEIQEVGGFNYKKLDEDGGFEGTVIETRKFSEDIHGSTHPILRKSCINNIECSSGDCDFDAKLCIQRKFGPYLVPERHVFVMGDNRDNSHDSRFWKKASVPIEFVKGRAIFIWWSYREDLVQWDRMFTKIH